MPKLPLYVIIMAGGQGTRFWPASRRRRPKQFLPILGRRSMLQETVARTARLCPGSRTLIVTGAEHAALVRRQVSAVPADNVIAEPVGRSTAPCIGLAAEIILRREKDALMIVLPADHAVADPRGLRSALRRAVELARRSAVLVTIGIRPTYPETGYGYLELGAVISGATPSAYAALAFHEKPTRARAEDYCRSGRFLWNSGMFVWRASVIRAAIARHLPRTAAALAPVGRAGSRRQRALAIRRAYRRVDAVSIDHGIMEKAERVAVVAGEFGWNDVGSWAAMPLVWGTDAAGNATRGDAVLLEAHDSVVFAGRRLVALLGVDDLVVVDSDDALLVCRRDRAQDVRRMVEELQRRRRTRLL